MTTSTERVGMHAALFRVLAEDIYSDMDIPPFDKSAMDGYACRRADLDQELEVLGVIAAGEKTTKQVGQGQCIKIMTGAMIPEGADTVIMVEHTANTEDGKIRFTGSHTPANIALKGEEVKAGELVWRKGTQILPQHMAMLASVGWIEPLVARCPTVAVLSTGDELVEPDTFPDAGRIRNSNGAQLVAQVKAAHCIAHYSGIIPDDYETTRIMIRKAVDEHDMVILSGGVSMGDFDYVPQIMREIGVEIVFQKVAIKPGRPTVFGRTPNGYIFGLPGYPVSSFINFEVMVKPLLYKMMGCDFKAREHQVKLGSDFLRKKDDRPEWLPAMVDESGHIMPVTYLGSAHIHAITLADGLMFIPLGVKELKKGETVTFRLLS